MHQSLYNSRIVFVVEGWWFVDLDSELGWVPASFLEPRDGSMDDQVLEIYEEGEGKIARLKRSSVQN